jgi:hypothetical protein
MSAGPFAQINIPVLIEVRTAEWFVGKPECAGINGHVVGDERALQERRTATPSWPRVLQGTSLILCPEEHRLKWVSRTSPGTNVLPARFQMFIAMS